MRLSTGIRVGILLIIPLVIGLETNSPQFAILVSLGVLNLSMPEGSATNWSLRRTLSITCLANASAIAIGTIIGTTGLASLVFLGLGFFLLSYLRVFHNSTPMLFTASILFSIGIGFPGGSLSASLDRFVFVLVGGLVGLGGALVFSHFHPDMRKPFSQNSSNQIETCRVSLRERFRPFTNDFTFKTHHFRFSLAFAVAGAAGLAVSLYLGINRDYWVIMTLALLLLREKVSETMGYVTSRVLGTVLGSLVGVAIIVTIHNQWVFIGMIFIFATIFYVIRRTNYVVGTFFITLFVLALVSLSNPGDASIAVARFVDTLIGAGISLLTVLILISGDRSFSKTLWD